MTAVDIRLAGVEDVDAVVACQDACWREAYTGLVPESYLDDPLVLRRRAERWRDRLAGERRVFVAVAGGEVVGVASAGPSRDPVPEPALELMTLYVRAGHHGSGLASSLLTAAIGAAPASLWVFEDNARAQAFYAKHGFRLDGGTKVDEDTGVPEARMVR